MKLHKIEMETWNRKECFEHYYHHAKCTYSITVKMDVSKLINYIKEKGYRLYPTFTWIVSNAINQQENLKMCVDENGQLGYYDEVGPCYSVLDDETKIMSDLYTPYDKKFGVFYQNMSEALDRFKEDPSYRTPFERNFYITSCIPWIEYSSFNVNNEGNNSFLFPMVTWGKYYEENGRLWMPLTIQVHHAVADGYHCALFFDTIKEILEQPEKDIQI